MKILSESDPIVRLADERHWEGQKGGGFRNGFVEQDKGTCCTVRHFTGIPQRTQGLFAEEAGLSSIPCRTVNSISGIPAFWVHISTLEAGSKMLGLCLGIALVAALLIKVGETFGILVANTDSAAPAGVYRVASPRIHRGDLVAACLPVAMSQWGLKRGYLRTGPCPGNAEPVGKIAAALPGDTVVIERTGVTINGRLIPHSTVASHDSAGRPLPHVPFGSYVASDQVWLFGFRNRRSWDARYFGPVPLSNVQGTLTPLLTW